MIIGLIQTVFSSIKEEVTNEEQPYPIGTKVKVKIPRGRTKRARIDNDEYIIQDYMYHKNQLMVVLNNPRVNKGKNKNPVVYVSDILLIKEED